MKIRVKNIEITAGRRVFKSRKYISLALYPQITITWLDWYYQLEIRLFHACFCVGIANLGKHKWLLSTSKQSKI
ncbi:MAG: hypothetical protein LBP83_05130 [Dysgonamonadaceae bacterium]|jgi:hypothetical protein|nr:hypothetical protein [Dysgonamonadaceae bacterium]